MPIVHLHAEHLEILAKERGHSWDDVKQAVLEWDVIPGVCKVDTEHEKFPSQPPSKPGVGAGIKKILERFGIKASPTCSCTKKAKYLDDMGVDWCAANIELIVTWLETEAKKRKLPFFRTVGRMLVKRAIKNARV
jgi:hypothetical protein